MNRLFFILLLLFVSSTYGQKKKEVKEANKLFKSEQYGEALPIFEKFISMDSNNPDYVYKYGACVLMTTDKTEQALKYLLFAEQEGKPDNEIAYFLGRAYEKLEDFEKALAYYERFKAAASKEEVKKLKVKKRIKSCKIAMK